MNFNPQFPFGFNPEELFQPIQLPKGLDFTLGGELAQVFMSSLIEIFEQNGGENFLTMTFLDEEGSKYGITIQNGNGKLTPEERINQLEAEKALLTQQAQQLQAEAHLARKEADYYKKSIQNLAMIDEQLEELEDKQEMLYHLKAVTFAEVLNK